MEIPANYAIMLSKQDNRHHLFNQHGVLCDIHCDVYKNVSTGQTKVNCSKCLKAFKGAEDQNNELKPGKFISFEGGEGSGKSTQIHLLANHLKSQGHEVVLTREPGGTKLGNHIRNLLQLDDAGEGMTPEAELLLFAADRAQHVRELILPAIKAGRIVLCDRFVDSTYVYQGIARALPLEQLQSITEFATGGLLPDLTLLLDIPVEEGMARVHARGEGLTRIEREADEFFRSVRQGYLARFKAEPQRIQRIDARPITQDVHQAIIETVKSLLT